MALTARVKDELTQVVVSRQSARVAETAALLRFAGQMTGCEGYVESAAMGLLAGRLAAAELQGETLPAVPATTAIGALLNHITGGAIAKTFQPMNVNFGLFPPLAEARGGRRGRADRYKGYTDRAKDDWAAWLRPEAGAQAAE